MVRLRQSKDAVVSKFNTYRTEGKELPAPTAEQVIAFAAQQKVATKWNSDLSPHDSKIIQRQWEKTSQEATPDGATFHAWQETMREIGKRARVKVAAVGASGMLALTMAACSSGGGNMPPVEATPTPTPSPSVISLIDYDTSKANGLVPGEVESDKWGEYAQATLSDDAEVVRTFAKDKYDKHVREKFTEEELMDAQAQTARFIVSQIIDNPTIMDPTPEHKDAYYEESKGAISKQWRDEWKEGIESGAASTTDWHATNITESGFTPVYHEGQTRLALGSISVREATVSENGKGLYIAFDVEYDREIDAEGDALRTHHTNQHRFNLALEKGAWTLTGWGTNQNVKAYHPDGTEWAPSEE